MFGVKIYVEVLFKINMKKILTSISFFCVALFLLSILSFSTKEMFNIQGAFATSTTKCTLVGGTTYCDDGSSYTKVGNSIYGVNSNGTSTYTKVGNSTIGYINYGTSTIRSTSTIVGNQTIGYVANGTSTSKSTSTLVGSTIYVVSNSTSTASTGGATKASFIKTGDVIYDADGNSYVMASTDSVVNFQDKTVVSAWIPSSGYVKILSPSQLKNYTNIVSEPGTLNKWGIVKRVVVPNQSKFIFNKDLSFGMVNNDVKQLQKFLNTNGFIVAKSGNGSPGKEVARFGPTTRAALIKFQKVKGINQVNGNFSSMTRTVINNMK